MLRLFNEEMDSYLVPFVAQRRLEYWVESTDLTVVSGTSGYPIPSVALAGKIRAVAYLVGGLPFLLDEIDLPMAVATSLAPATTQYPVKYYFQGANIILWPQPSSGGVLRLYYYRRPSQLVANASCAQITAIGAVSGGKYTLTCGTVPSTWATTNTFDLVSNIPNFTLYANSLTSDSVVTGASGTVRIVASSVPAGLAVGDWVCLYDTAPVLVGAPAELTTLLVQQVAFKMAEAKGANETVERLASGLRQAEHSAAWTVQKRNDGAMRKVSAFPGDVSAYPWFGG